MSNDIERFHQLLIRTVARAMPTRMPGPFSLAEIRDTLLPYRASRRHVGVDTVEDYEAVLLRFASGEANLATLDDPNLLRLFERERNSSNPDLSLVALHGKATLTLSADGIARAHAATQVVESMPEALAEPFAPLPIFDSVMPAAQTFAAIIEPAVPVDVPVHSPIEDVICLYCGGSLPTGREVKFCPHCGQNQLGVHCPSCQTAADPGWKHCVSCGATLPGWS